MDDIKKLTKIITDFRGQRDWKQFHNPKDLSISLVLEATEVLEHFQWKSAEEMAGYIKNSKGAVGEELADVLYWVLLLANDLNIDIVKAFKLKMQQNETKYPVKKAKGNHKKYNQL
jgi:dCTP diphosphatase